MICGVERCCSDSTTDGALSDCGGIGGVVCPYTTQHGKVGCRQCSTGQCGVQCSAVL